jgi:response regulator RpfG family c-di-GMP phosphodiesterase
MTGQLPTIPCQVLLVDDEENILRSITRLLLEDGGDLEVLSATSGAQGLEILARHPDVALILSDQRMPGMSGAEFLQRAREVAPDAIRMVLTGYADMADTMDAINKGGATRYLLKPWDDDMLRRTILEGVELYRLLQENRRLSALVAEQNAELSEWNANLKGRVLEQTATIRQQNEELKSRNRQVTRAFGQIIVAFSRLIEQHSSRLQEHTGNVTALAVGVAGDLGLPAEEIETIRIAALLHEIGVIGIAPEILSRRPADLSREELGLFLQHAVRGQTAVDEVEELRGAGVLIRHHHERYEGEGFPDRLVGLAIPLGARIICFADFIDHDLEEERGEAAVRGALYRATRELGRQLDPELFSLMEPRIRALYSTEKLQEDPDFEKELRPKQLLEGMQVTRNLYSAAGLLLIPRGTLLDTHQITTIGRHYRVDPPAGGIHVSWRPADPDTHFEPAGARVWDPMQDKEGPGAAASRVSRELPARLLQEGMRTTRNLYSGTGLLLLNEGTLLDAGKIAAIVRYYEIDPPACGVFVARNAA